MGGRTPVGGRSVLFVTQKMPCGSFVWPRGRERNVAKEQLAIKQSKELESSLVANVMFVRYAARAIRANPLLRRANALLRPKRCFRAILGLGLQLAVAPRCA